MVNLTSKSALEVEKEAWRKAGLPLNAYELDQWYKRVPPERNAALRILEARDNLVTASAQADPGTISAPEPGKPASPELLAALEDYLGKNRTTLDLLHQAAELPESRYPVNLSAGFNALLPHLAQVKSMAQMLKHEAFYQSHKGNREGAVRALHTGFALGRSLRNEPILISDLVRIACIAINLSAVERLLSEHQLTEKEIELLAADMAQAEEDGKSTYYRALIGERTNASMAFALSFSEFQALSNMGGPAAIPSPAQQVFGNTMFMLYKAAGLRQRDTRIFLETMHDFIAAGTNQFPEALRLSETAEKTFEEKTQTGLGRIAIFSRMLLPALTKAITKEARLAASLRAGRIALLVEKHRLQHSALPASLAELESTLPVDSYDGQPFELRLENPGYRIVSVTGSKVSGTKTNPFIGMRVAR